MAKATKKAAKKGIKVVKTTVGAATTVPSDQVPTGPEYVQAALELADDCLQKFELVVAALNDAGEVGYFKELKPDDFSAERRKAIGKHVTQGAFAISSLRDEIKIMIQGAAGAKAGAERAEKTREIFPEFKVPTPDVPVKVLVADDGDVDAKRLEEIRGHYDMTLAFTAEGLYAGATAENLIRCQTFLVACRDKVKALLAQKGAAA